MKEDFDFSQEEYSAILERLIEALTTGKKSVEHPVAIVLGGQPGAGKNNLYIIANDRFDDNIVEIDCDKFRELHPKAEEIYKHSPDEYAEKTNPFVYKLADDLSSYTGEHKMNFITESSMRTPDTHLQICDKFIPKGYSVETHVMATSRYVSRISIEDRYNDEKANGKYPRKVSKEFHDLAADSIPDSLSVIYSSGKMSNILICNRDRECLYDMSKTPDINPKQLLFDIVNDVNSNEKYDKMSEKDLSDLKKVCDKDWLSLAMWKGNKAEEINRITYNYNGSMWRGNVFSKGKAVGDFVAFEFEAIMKKLPQVSVMIKAETLIKEKDITPKNFEKKKEMISQKVSEAKKNNRKATYENTSYQEKAMIEKENYNRLVEAARNKNVLEYFQESGYNIEKKGGQYYITEIAGLVINAEKNQWYSHYENIGRTNNTLDCLTKVLDIDFKQAVYDLTGKDISSIKSASNNYNYSNKPLYTTRPVVKAITSTAKAEKELMMPEQSENFRQMFAYMIKTRKIPPHIIEELVKAKLLYQTSFKHNSYINHNAVFVHKNQKGEVVGGEIQGCNSSQRFKGVVTGTQDSCFIFTPYPSENGSFKRAYIFESSIDLMSFYSYCNKEKIKETAFISMAGLKPTVPKRLQEQGVQIISCVDNDDKGRKFEKENDFIRPDGIKKVLDDKGFKDWNELLVFQTEHPNSIFDKDFHKSDIEEKSLAETTQDVMAETIQNDDDDIEEMGGMTM